MSKMIYYKVKSPMHIGDEQGLGAVDMPIQREQHTGFPIMPASSIKGVFKRDYNIQLVEEIKKEQQDIEKQEELAEEIGNIFGGDDKRGRIVFNEGKILFYPIKSAKGLYMLITCPYIIDRYKSDLGRLKVKSVIHDANNSETDAKNNKLEAKEIQNQEIQDNEIAIVSEDNKGVIRRDGKGKCIILEEFMFEVKEEITEEAKVLLGIKATEELHQKMVIVSDSTFSHMVELYTEIRTRVNINEMGIAENPFTEEFVPKEAIFYSEIVDENKEEGVESETNPLFRLFQEDQCYMQIGGNKTLGKGMVACHIVDVEDETGDEETNE